MLWAAGYWNPTRATAVRCPGAGKARNHVISILASILITAVKGDGPGESDRVDRGDGTDLPRVRGGAGAPPSAPREVRRAVDPGRAGGRAAWLLPDRAQRRHPGSGRGQRGEPGAVHRHD